MGESVIIAIPWLVLVLVVGAISCLPLFDWDVRRFVRSPLALKIVIWIPLYLLFLASAFSWLTACVVGLVLAMASLVEWMRQRKRRRVVWYEVYFVLSCVAWPLLAWLVSDNPSQFVALCLISVFSDVFAFFFGSFMGVHHLPKWVNARKTFEGVAGQIVGSLTGVFIVNTLFHTDISWLLGGLIGLASTFGDLSNSIAKRQLGVKDWGNTIPGHGGVNDRFSSLNAALVVAALLYSL